MEQVFDSWQLIGCGAFQTLSYILMMETGDKIEPILPANICGYIQDPKSAIHAITTPVVRLEKFSDHTLATTSSGKQYILSVESMRIPGYRAILKNWYIVTKPHHDNSCIEIKGKIVDLAYDTPQNDAQVSPDRTELTIWRPMYREKLADGNTVVVDIFHDIYLLLS